MVNEVFVTPSVHLKLEFNFCDRVYNDAVLATFEIYLILNFGKILLIARSNILKFRHKAVKFSEKMQSKFCLSTSISPLTVRVNSVIHISGTSTKKMDKKRTSFQ